MTEYFLSWYIYKCKLIIALLIKKGEPFIQPAVTVKDKLNSGFVNNIFYPAFVHAKKFYATDACISCGKCAKVCPLSNIHLDRGKPVWGKNCTHCMACICRCPAEAIEYGRHSRGLVRYVCPKVTVQGWPVIRGRFTTTLNSNVRKIFNTVYSLFRFLFWLKML